MHIIINGCEDIIFCNMLWNQIIQVKWNSILQEETIGECLPQLAAGKMTPAQMVETADESIREYEKER